MEVPIIMATDTTENWNRNDTALGNGELAIEIAGSREDGTLIQHLLIGDGKPTGPNVARLRATLEIIAELREFIGNQIAVEAAARASADQALQDSINSQIAGERTAREEAIQGEATARAIADQALQDSINSQIAGERTAREEAIQGEATARANADQALQDSINSQIAGERTAWEEAIQGEATARANADQALQGSINSQVAGERTAREEAIQAEAAARQQSDNELDNAKINRSVAGAKRTLVQSVEVKEVTSNGFVAAHRNINVENGDVTETQFELPQASEDESGIMPAESFKQITENSRRIDILEGRGVIYSVELNTDNPSQAELQAAFEAATGMTGTPPDQMTLHDIIHNKKYIFFSTRGEWVDMGTASSAPFTNTTHGLIRGVNAPGKIFAENDGTGSVVGWTELNTKVENLESDTANNQVAIALLEQTKANNVEGDVNRVQRADNAANAYQAEALRADDVDVNTGGRFGRQLRFQEANSASHPNGGWASVLTALTHSTEWQQQLAFPYAPGDGVFYRQFNGSTTSGPWRQLAFLDSLTSINKYTFVIDSDAALAAWANNAEGNDYSRILIKAGTWTFRRTMDSGTVGNPNAFIDISDGRTLSVTGEAGSRIDLSGGGGQRHWICGIRGSATGSNGNFFENVFINLHSGNNSNYNSVFWGCSNLTNCTASRAGTGGNQNTIFRNCSNLTNCTASNTGNASADSAFRDCSNLTNCTGTSTGIGSVSAFRDCSNLTNCTGSSIGIGFWGCSNLVNCTGTGSGLASSNGGGFRQCRTGFGNRNGPTASPMGAFVQCLMAQGTGLPTINDWANTAAGGWNDPSNPGITALAATISLDVEFLNARNPVWIDDSTISLEVQFEVDGHYATLMVSATDATYRELFERAEKGDFGTVRKADIFKAN